MFKYTDYSNIVMAHKTITISEDAYNSLNKLKKKNESFTDVILRLTIIEKKKNNLLKWVNSKKANNNLADAIHDTLTERDTVELRNF